jgi:membrane-associated protease RseP (regulator of RpoE activity)
MDILFIWVVFILVFMALAYLLGERGGVAARGKEDISEQPSISSDTLKGFAERVARVLAVTRSEVRGAGVMFEGRLKSSPEGALAELRQVFAPDRLAPLLQDGTGGDVRLVLIPESEALVQRSAVVEKPNWAVHLLLFVVTLLTTTWAGALHAGVNLLQEPGRIAVGLPYSLGLMLILGAHELGHYFTARRHRVWVTPPYFIPAPFALGTFGAFIRIKSLSPDRRATFDVALAGPLAGLVFAIPALLIGLRQSRIVIESASPEMVHTGMQIGSSFLMAIMAKLALGASTLEGHQLILHPLAFAGWLGLLVTALNLLPIGQLDGGHIAHAMFGARRGHAISVGGLMTLFALALFVWPGLMMWALVVWFIAGHRDAPPLNDVTPLNTGRRVLGWLVFVILAAILIPVPHALYPTFGIHCPYL